VLRHDLEGIVAKRKADAYGPRAKWIKIKNSAYSQADGARPDTPARMTQPRCWLLANRLPFPAGCFFVLGRTLR
jgi:hypothetical protein